MENGQIRKKTYLHVLKMLKKELVFRGTANVVAMKLAW